MPRRSRLILACALAMVMAFASSAGAHPEHPDGPRSTQEDFPGEGVLGVSGSKQHSEDDGHLPARQDNVRLVGKAQIADRSAEQVGIEGRVADVAAYGDHAYLGAYFEPSCDAGGVHVMDIADPANPVEVEDAFIPAKTGQFVGEGVQVLEYRNRYFQGPVLFHSNETCGDPAPGEPVENSGGGISLWDVANPEDPSPLAQNAGDLQSETGTVQPRANDVHSVFAWHNSISRRTYAVLLDSQTPVLDILDVTDPRNPVLVTNSLDLTQDAFDVQQDVPENLNEVFAHDASVKRIGLRYVMTVDLWDGGYVLLDVTDPGRSRLIDETDYADLDEEQAQRGRVTPPEGNAHQSEISPDNRFVIGTDEDFAPFEITATVDTGPFAGTEFVGVQSGDSPTLTEENSITGPTTFLGLACGDPAALPEGTGTAVVERGVCSFQEKLDNARARGYSAVIVFNSVREDCDALLNPLAASDDVPFFFVDRATGLQILGQEFDPAAVCTTEVTAEVGAAGSDVTIAARFNGWGYVRLFDTNLKRTRAGIVADQRQVDTYAIPEAQDPAYAVGFGDLSVHEVAIDPDREDDLAYFSYYAGGFRVAEYGDDGLREVGAFIDEGGSNFWGVEVHEVAGEQYVLASDRDYGLYIFQYDPAVDGPENDPR